jgi:prolyl-tRNA synthetase
MLQSELFTRTSKHDPEGETAKNAKLLVRGGFIAKSSAGVYSLLPLGLRVLNRINTIIREEMHAIGAEELLMPSLIERKYWQQSKRWETDVIYRTGAKTATRTHEGEFEYGLGWTHEEVIAHIATNFIQSYRDLPRAVYQIQTKFRAEVRAQGGLLRGREFLMKDLYSFHEDVDDLSAYYETVLEAYKKIYSRLGLKALVVEASGGAFTKEYTHEFQVLSDAGEDTVFYCKHEACGFAQNKEVFDASRHQGCAGKLKEARAIEVGNIFKLGTKFSEAFGLTFTDETGEKRPVVMGSYGIGPTRILGTLVEVLGDERGMAWPESVAPFAVHLLRLGGASELVEALAHRTYETLKSRGIEVLYDDRESVSAGEKFADADLIGAPYRVVVSEKSGDKLEVKRRGEREGKMTSLELFVHDLANDAQKRTP